MAWIGLGDGKAADGAAVEATRNVFANVPFDGRVAIGEGESDDAPMLWIGEFLGSMKGELEDLKIDIAVDLLECTNRVPSDLPNAMALLTAEPRGALLHVSDCCMDKISGAKELNSEISLDAGTAYNVEAACAALGKKSNELKVVVMDRPRHKDLIKEFNEYNLNVIKIGDGDIWAALDDISL